MKFRSNHLPGINSSIARPTAPSLSSLPANITLHSVTSVLDSCGTIPNPHNQDSQLSSRLFRGIPCNKGRFYHLLDVKGLRQHRPYTYEGPKDVTQGRICHRGWRKGRGCRRSSQLPKETSKGREQKVPTGSQQFKGTRTYQIWFRQNSPHALLREISLALWTLTQCQYQNAENKPFKDVHGPLSLVKSKLSVRTADSQRPLAHPSPPDAVPLPPAAG